MFVQFVALCYYEYFGKQIRQIRSSLGKQRPNDTRTKKIIEAEEKLRNWMENTPLYLQLQWFDAIEEVKVSSELHAKRWSTEITSRDRLYLEKLGVIPEECF